jgi:hypothetical protein
MHCKGWSIKRRKASSTLVMGVRRTASWCTVRRATSCARQERNVQRRRGQCGPTALPGPLGAEVALFQPVYQGLAAGHEAAGLGLQSAAALESALS